MRVLILLGLKSGWNNAYLSGLVVLKVTSVGHYLLSCVMVLFQLDVGKKLMCQEPFTRAAGEVVVYPCETGRLFDLPLY